MEVTFFHKNLNKNEETAFLAYVEKKLPSIQNLLKKFAADATLLKVTIEKFDKHTAYEVELRLKLPAASIVAKEASHQIARAVDLSKDRLVEQIKKHMDGLRGQRAHRSVRDFVLEPEPIESLSRSI
ncbi:MAG: HPF/RaiA family ribosome-associated protein [Patescibacteria group bacterium]